MRRHSAGELNHQLGRPPVVEDLRFRLPDGIPELVFDVFEVIDK
jgi:hypothetical protein